MNSVYASVEPNVALVVIDIHLVYAISQKGDSNAFWIWIFDTSWNKIETKGKGKHTCISDNVIGRDKNKK